MGLFDTNTVNFAKIGQQSAEVGLSPFLGMLFDSSHMISDCPLCPKTEETGHDASMDKVSFGS
jgi:hypothetical protein